MNARINATKLRASLPDIVRRVRQGARFTVTHRSQPAFQIVPVGDDVTPPAPLAYDPVYQADAVGRSQDGRAASGHDALLYEPSRALTTDRHFKQTTFQMVPAARGRTGPK